MNLRIYFIGAVFIMMVAPWVKGQGCSDAGFCTINSIRDHSSPVPKDSILKNTIKAGLSYGIGDFDIKIVSPYLEYGNSSLNNLTLSGKITYVMTDGELGKFNNPGDLFFSSSYLINASYNTSINFISGIKIPLNNASATNNSGSLPMNYQSSLGTFDLIFGLNVLFKDLGVSFAMQQPIIDINKNDFITPADPGSVESKYQSTNNYIRKGDILNRISYTLDIFKHRFLIRPSILSIYHMADDTYADIGNENIYINGSQGLTLNGNIFLTYNISKTGSIELILGTPFVTRKSRPDGLTREFVAAFEYIISF